MEVPGVSRNYTAHLFSIQAKCYLGDVAETRVRTTMPQQPLCGVRAAGWQKVRLKFLYTMFHSCAPEVCRPPTHGFSLYISSSCAKLQNSRPVPFQPGTLH